MAELQQLATTRFVADFSVSLTVLRSGKPLEQLKRSFR
jgi:hypothetical protein